MAQNTPPNNQNQQNIDQLHSIQSNLFTITDQYKEWNKQANINNSVTRDTLHQSTTLGRIISKSLDIQSKIGKEIVNQKTVNRTILSLQSEAEKIVTKYNATYKSLTSYQKKQIDMLVHQRDVLQTLQKESDKLYSDQQEYAEEINNLADELNLLQSRGLNNSVQYQKQERALISAQQMHLRISNDRKATEQQILAINQSITKAYKDQSVTTAMMQKEQAESAKQSMEILETIPKQVEESNKSLQKHNFFKEAFKRVPILDQFHTLPKLMSDFGGKGVLALGVIGAIGLALEKIVEMMFKADKQVTDIQKTFGLSRDAADQMRQSFYETAQNASKLGDIQKETLFTEQDVFETQMQLVNLFGTAVKLTDRQLAQLTNVSKVIGLSEESMKGLMTYAFGSGKSIDEIDRTVAGTSKLMQLQNGLQLDNKQILEEVYKTTGGIRANFKGNVQELAKAVTQTKLYGTSLQQVQQTSDSLLDFESSIENQLEAELLTGRQINLERARAAALVGDMNTVMQEMNKEAGGYDRFMKLNVIAQNSLAKAFGFTRDEMADMMFQQKALEGLRKLGNNEENKSLTERYNDLVKLGKSTKELTDILGQDALNTLAKQSAQERFNKAIEKLEDVFSRLVEGGLLQKVINGIAGLANYLSEGGNVLGALFNTEGYQKAKEEVQKQIGSVQDGVISPQGAIMISTPKGQISTSPGDSIIATTNPGSLMGGSQSTDLKEISSKLDKLIEVISKGGNVYMDGRKMGTVQALAYNATL